MASKKIAEDELRRREKTLLQKEKELKVKEKELAEFHETLTRLQAKLCPECGHELQLVAAENLEVHACEECRGAWIDRSSMEILIKYTIDRRKNFFTKVFGLT